jgi:hypothetical protein
MGRISKAHKRYLEEKLGKRVTFNKTERKLHGCLPSAEFGHVGVIL